MEDASKPESCNALAGAVELFGRQIMTRHVMSSTLPRFSFEKLLEIFHLVPVSKVHTACLGCLQTVHAQVLTPDNRLSFVNKKCQERCTGVKRMMQAMNFLPVVMTNTRSLSMDGTSLLSRVCCSQANFDAWSSFISIKDDMKPPGKFRQKAISLEYTLLAGPLSTASRKYASLFCASCNILSCMAVSNCYQNTAQFSTFPAKVGTLIFGRFTVGSR